MFLSILNTKLLGLISLFTFLVTVLWYPPKVLVSVAAMGVVAVFKSFLGGIGFEAPCCSAVLGGKSWDIQEPFLPNIL